MQPPSIPSFLALALSLAATTPVTFAQTQQQQQQELVVLNNHTTVTPATNYTLINERLATHLPPVPFALTEWPSGWVPEGCLTFVQSRNLSASNLTVYDALYADCAVPWQICHHVSSPASITDLATLFGRVPVGARSLVRTLTGVPGGGALAGIGGLWRSPGDILITDTSTIGIMLHEASHGLDWVGLRGRDNSSTTGAFSDGSVWRTSYSLDSAVPTDYSRTNFREDFAEIGPIAILDRELAGGIATVQPAWAGMAHQIATYQGFLGDAVLQNGQRCGARVAVSRPVFIGMTTASGGGNATTTTRRRGVGTRRGPPIAVRDASVAIIEVDVGDEVIEEACELGHHHHFH